MQHFILLEGRGFNVLVYLVLLYYRTTEVYIKLNSEKNYSIQNRIPHLKLDLIIPERLQIYRLKRYVNK